jgi:hypothetical protein
MTSIEVFDPEAFSAEFEEFEQAIADSMDDDASGDVRILMGFGFNRNDAESMNEEFIAARIASQPTIEELLDFFGA